MTVSQPSRDVYVIDVPEVGDFNARFNYNFFTPDESVNESGGVPVDAVTRHSDAVDSAFIQYSTTRAPRVVVFNFSLPKLADVGGQVTELSQRDNKTRQQGEQDGSLIKRNLDKVVTEDVFTSNNFISVSFHDGKIDDKVHELVSGSYVQAMLSSAQPSQPPSTSPFKAAQGLIPLLPKTVSSQFIFRAMTLPEQSTGAKFYVPLGKLTTPSGARSGAGAPKLSFPAVDTWFVGLKNVVANAQVNVKLFHDLVDRTIGDPVAPQAGDMVPLHTYTGNAKDAANQRFSPAISEDDYKSFVPYIDVKRQPTATHPEKYSASLVGFIIDKFEVLPDGTTKAHPPIVIDTPHAGVWADYLVKFNAEYCYTIRTIALLRLPAVDDSTGLVATLKVLISSKPSNKVYVKTVQFDAPPPPGDVNFVWNYETRRLLVTWAFPVTSERDIKKFQVYRRAGIDEPFELQKVYDFDDSVVKFPDNEDPDPQLVETLTSPATFWIDDEFDPSVNKNEERGWIYSIVAIDAHGLTSNYSAQFRVWFDQFKNRLQKRLVSHAGAPKPYPNLYLEGDLFVDTIRTSGPNSRRMKLYFNPEYYYVYDNDGRLTKVLATQQTGGSYQLQFLNTDNMGFQKVNVSIDDRLTAAPETLSRPTISFTPRRPT